MATVNSGTYRPVGIADARSTELVIWILVATVLFTLLFLVGEGADFKEGSTVSDSSVSRLHGAGPQASISERPNGSADRSASY
jgi:hypothetical protein